jgi:hypothetical protein
MQSDEALPADVRRELIVTPERAIGIASKSCLEG